MTGRRIFNNSSFEQGGRIYGWAHYSIPKHQRHRIRIKGEPVLEVDYQAMHLRLLYHRKGLDYPLHLDPFDPVRLGLPGVERKAIKKAFNKSLNMSAPAKRHCPEFESIIAALRREHAPIEEAIFSGVGLRLMRLDSDITVRVLLRLIEAGVVVLPIHDGFLARQVDEAVVREAMMMAYQCLVDGHTPRVEVKAYVAMAA